MQITKQQLIEAYKNPHYIGQIRQWVNKYYDNPTSLVIEFDNMYNDEGYHTRIQYISVFRNGEEILPKEGLSKESRKRWGNLPSLDYDYLAQEIDEDLVYDDEIIEEIEIIL